MSDWREPFLRLRENLRPLYDSNLNIYHDVILSTNRNETELRPIFEMLEPAYKGKKLVKTIPVNTEGCSYHAHLFFADDLRGLFELERHLVGIEDWFDALPPSFVPSFDIPPDRSQTNRNIMRWVSLVYYVASASDAPYLEIELEHQESIDRVGFFSWIECLQPPKCRPLQWLIHQGSSVGRITSWRQKFEERGERIPDIIDAYLTGEFVMSSMAAIDILAYRLNAERRQKAIESTDYAKKLKRTVPKYAHSKANLGKLAMVLHAWHQPGRIRKRPWLIQKEIAEKAGILTKDHEPAKSTVSRLLEAIFGKDPMDKYRKLAEANDGGEKLRRVLKEAREKYEKYYLGDYDED